MYQGRIDPDWFCVKEILRLDNVEKYYGRGSSLTKAADGISFTVSEGDLVVIMGPSGCGKTTVLNCISAIDDVTSGKVFLDGEDLTKLSRKAKNALRKDKLGIILQDYNLLNNLTVYENISLAMSIKGMRVRKDDPAIFKLASELDIRDLLDRFPDQLSNGQRQRAATVRALITSPSILLADEPTGALDSESSSMLLSKISYLNQVKGVTVLMVTHDVFAASYGNRVIFMKDGTLFHEINRGDKSRNEFFDEIVSIYSLSGRRNISAD